MAPTMGLNNSGQNNVPNSESPLSKTYQYRKQIKPLLERKRRARINRCLDELKELITGAIQNTESEENITKLEKADILELTVRHFHNLKRQNKFHVKSETYADRFKDGFALCAKEVTQFLYNANHNRAGEHIMVHLNDCIHRLEGLGNNINNNYVQSNNNINNIKNNEMELNHSPYLTQPKPNYLSFNGQAAQQQLPREPLMDGKQAKTVALYQPHPEREHSPKAYHQHIQHLQNLQKDESVWRPW